MDELRAAAEASKAWPFEEARKLAERYAGAPPAKGHVLFETGYGPSGLPHIGTFGEVARTTMIRRAFETISDLPTRLVCFSDDLDGMRKVPDNVPNQEMLRANLQRPLTSVPDPFGEHESFGAHNNAMLRRFLDTFGFEYEFVSATEFYRSGRFDAVLRRAAERYDALMEVMLASLREERQQTYSIFLPISPQSGRVLYVPLKEVNAAEGTITFDDEDGTETVLPVTGGNVKLQWKPDFGARWAALDVDFEMYGKDHSTNTPIYDAICEILGGRAPEHFTYELFLDEQGEKISKSKGNGLTIDEWLSYADPESLSYFMYGKPKTAKRLYFDVIPKNVDEYHQQLARLRRAGHRGAAGEPGLAHPSRAAAGLGHAGELCHAPQPRERGECRATRACSGGLSAAMRRRRARRRTRSSMRRRGTRCGISRTSCGRRSGTGRRMRARRRRSRTCAGGWRRGRGRRMRRGCRTSSSRSATSTASTRSGPGSGRSTRCCSGRSRGRASAGSSRFTGWRRRSR